MSVGIGIIRYIDEKRGVIEPQKLELGGKQIPSVGLYFKLDQNQGKSFHQGQLVKFVTRETPDGAIEATDLMVLSDTA